MACFPMHIPPIIDIFTYKAPELRMLSRKLVACMALSIAAVYLGFSLLAGQGQHVVTGAKVLFDTQTEHQAHHSSRLKASQHGVSQAGISVLYRKLQPDASAAASQASVLQHSHISCTGSTFSKQSCMFTNICLQPNAEQQTLTAWLFGMHVTQQQCDVLQQQLEHTFEGMSLTIDARAAPVSSRNSQLSGSTAAASPSSSNLLQEVHHRSRAAKFSSSKDGDWNAAAFQTELAATLLWRMSPHNLGSFGHALVNEAFPMFLVLQNHFGQQIPADLQLLATPADTLKAAAGHMIQGTVTRSSQHFVDRVASLPAGKVGVCFRQLVMGDGGYQRTSRASLANGYIYAPNPVTARFFDRHPTQYAEEPSFFSSSNWWNFRQHTLQLNGITEQAYSNERPLVLLNDKRFGVDAQPDRRSIIDIDGVAANISAAYPSAEVQAVRFRDLPWPDQLRLLSRAKVLITTQGSSAFRLVFMPKGSVCIMVGAPEPSGSSVWTSFHELDRWFPLTYMQFSRYEVALADEHEYVAKVWPGMWQPHWAEPLNRRAWWLYNADIKLDMNRLLPMLGNILPKH